MSEGKYISELFDCDNIDVDALEASYERQLEKKISLFKDRYEKAENTKVGNTFACCTCGKEIVKKSYQRKFCTNKGKGNCKDTYWNVVDDQRRNQAQFITSGKTASEKFDQLREDFDQ